MMVNTEKLNYYKSRMFSGYDTDTTMLRIGAMNMLLHKIDDPNIQEQDSLSTENHDAERYSLILANPPFTGSLDKEVVSPTLKNLTKTNKTELLFWLYSYVLWCQVDAVQASFPMVFSSEAAVLIFLFERIWLTTNVCKP